VRLLVLGAGGQLGSELVEAATRAGEDAVGLTRAECDITDAAAVKRALHEQAPGAVVNCAAWTAVDAAEDHPEEAHRVNAHGPEIIAAGCEQQGARFCHISTDYVFDGTATAPIAEDAVPRPLSVYGRSKLEGEVAVRRRCTDHLIVRTSWVYGRAGPNFVLTVLGLIDAHRSPLRMVADQQGSPTWTGHLAPALLRLLRIAPPGLYHMGGSGAASRYDQAGAVAEALGGDVVVVAAASREFPARATRPRYSVLDNSAWRAIGEADLPAWREGVSAYLAELGRLQQP
jgi:dTDP-4-dehydrorhamnose reductase